MPGPIDLLDVEAYKHIYLMDSLGEGFPSAYSSIFGWVMMGRATSKSHGSHHAVSMSSTVELNSILTKFWEVEKVPTEPIQDPEDLLCEKHFVGTHSRYSLGRFMVRQHSHLDMCLQVQLLIALLSGFLVYNENSAETFVSSTST